MSGKPLIEVITPLGFQVRTTDSYWALIQKKHPEVTSKLSYIQQTLTEPEFIRQSQKDKKVFLFYKSYRSYWLCVVVKQLDGESFIITAYLTDKIKEGEVVWPK